MAEDELQLTVEPGNTRTTEHIIDLIGDLVKQADADKVSEWFEFDATAENGRISMSVKAGPTLANLRDELNRLG